MGECLSSQVSPNLTSTGHIGLLCQAMSWWVSEHLGMLCACPVSKPSPCYRRMSLFMGHTVMEVAGVTVTCSAFDPPWCPW